MKASEHPRLPSGPIIPPATLSIPLLRSRVISPLPITRICVLDSERGREPRLDSCEFFIVSRLYDGRNKGPPGQAFFFSVPCLVVALSSLPPPPPECSDRSIFHNFFEKNSSPYSILIDKKKKRREDENRGNKSLTESPSSQPHGDR